MANGRFWNETELLIVELCYAHLSARVLARVLGRSATAVKAAGMRFGLAQSRRWTAREQGIVRALHGSKTAAQIARRLGRTSSQVCQAAGRLGLTRRQPGRAPGLDDYITARHAEGWTDPEIARGWGCERHCIHLHRKRLGLASNANNERYRARVRINTQRQCEQAGVASLADIRCQVFRRRARAAGWPEDLRPRAVQILTTLWERGPMTRRELADAIGMPWHGVRASLKSSDPEGSHLAHLVKRGLVVNLGRTVRGRGRGHSVCLYSLPLFIERGKVSA